MRNKRMWCPNCGKYVLAVREVNEVRNLLITALLTLLAQAFWNEGMPVLILCVVVWLLGEISEKDCRCPTCTYYCEKAPPKKKR